MVFKLVDAAQKSWRRLDGHNQLPKLIQAVRFTEEFRNGLPRIGCRLVERRGHLLTPSAHAHSVMTTSGSP
jgi:hypothetical protein